LFNLYYRLPAPARSIAASIRGYYLRSWRYGPETERIAEEALEREQWTSDQWREYQLEELCKLLHRAATQVPFYREHWAKRRRKGDQASWDYLENWPLVEKEDIRRDPQAFLADDCDPKKMFRVRTSGTTGKPIDLWFSRQTHTNYYGLCEARNRYWYGLSRHDRWAIQGAHLVVPITARRPPFWVWNSAFQQLYLSAFHMTRQRIPDFLDALVKYRIVYLYGYPQYLYIIAKEMLRLNRRDVKMKVVIGNAEPLFDYQREVITEAFDCPVRETWGMSEIVGSAGECQHGQLHLWPECGFVEVLKDGQPLPTDVTGDLVCTGLLNRDMPLIRYRVGDRGALAGDQTCHCGRTLPILKSLDGRTTEFVYLPDGKMINRFEPVFVTELPLVEAQVIQDSLNRIRILYVPTDQFSAVHEEMMLQRTRDRMGNPNVEIVAESTNSIPRTPAGKFQTIVCNLSAEDRAKVERGEACPSA
jgi:phenylacetate-CoA ligase